MGIEPLQLLTSHVLSKMYAHAEETYPEECCGFVHADESIHKAVNVQSTLHLQNPERVTRDGRTGYTLSPQNAFLLNKSFGSDNPVEILYHSHPDVGAYFSDEDKRKALIDGHPVFPVAYGVIDVREGSVYGSKIFIWNGSDFVDSVKR